MTITDSCGKAFEVADGPSVIPSNRKQCPDSELTLSASGKAVRVAWHVSQAGHTTEKWIPASQLMAHLDGCFRLLSIPSWLYFKLK